MDELQDNFNDNLIINSNAVITGINIAAHIIDVQYQLEGKSLHIFTKPCCLIAALQTVMPLFKNPLENLADYCTSHKNIC